MNNIKSRSVNCGKPYTDAQLELILATGPIPPNRKMLATMFGRGEGAITQIWRWAHATKEQVQRKRPDDAFVAQIRRVARKIRLIKMG